MAYPLSDVDSDGKYRSMGNVGRARTKVYSSKRVL